jgi:hypothetical protein
MMWAVKRAILIFLTLIAIAAIHLPLLHWPNAFWSITSLLALVILNCAVEGIRKTP